jgi:hypothetical protein
MYFGSLNEIFASFICIINIIRFEFQFQILFFYSNQALFALVCNSISHIQLYPAKFTFVKNMLR